MTEWLLLGAVVVLILLNGIFVAAEFAFVTVDRPTVARLAETGDKRAGSLQAALRKMSTQLSGAQFGITVTSLVVGVIAEPSIATLLRGPLGLTGLSDTATTGISLTAAFILATFSQMVFGELVPKNWAISEPVRVGRAVAGTQRGFTAASRPFLFVLQGSANWLIRRLGIEPQEELASARTPGELSSLATRSAAQGMLDQRLARRVEHSIEMAERTAADAMTPRTQVTFLDSDATASDVLVAAHETGHARFPVMGEDVDDIIGVVHFKHALAVPLAERETRLVTAMANPVREVPSPMPLDAALAELRTGLQMAVVIDEYGGTAGILTLEDIVEEIVGEISDEQDEPGNPHVEIGDRAWSLDGLLRPDEVEEITGVQLPEGRDSDTLAGLITEELERFAEVGDSVEVEARHTGNLDEDGIAPTITALLTVRHLDGRRIDRVLLTVVEPDDEENADV